MCIWEQIEKIRLHFMDDLSRDILASRVSYSFTRDKRYIKEIVAKLPERDWLSIKYREAYIFGCGTYGKKLWQYVPVNWQGFIDNNSQIQGGMRQA